jgi:hypothetical protein
MSENFANKQKNIAEFKSFSGKPAASAAGNLIDQIEERIFQKNENFTPKISKI